MHTTTTPETTFNILIQYRLSVKFSIALMILSSVLLSWSVTELCKEKFHFISFWKYDTQLTLHLAGKWVFHDRRFCQIIWQIFIQGREKEFRQKLPSAGIETRTSRSSGQCLTNWARQESVGQEISEVSLVCFMHNFICWTLFISRINTAWLYKGHEDSGWQLNVDLAQLVRHWPEDLEVLVSIPARGNFLTKFFFALPCINICQIIWQKRLSWKTQRRCVKRDTCTRR